MIPLVATGIASVASNLIEAWKTSAQRKVDVQQAKFEGALGKAMGLGAATPQAQTAAQASALRSQIMDSPEVKTALGSQDPTRGAYVQISNEGRMWLHHPGGGYPTEVRLSPETQAAAMQLAALLPQQTSAPATVALR